MRRRLADRALLAGSWVSTGIILAAVLVLVGYLASRGGGALGLRLLFGDADPLAAITGRQPVFGGIWPALAGTCALVLVASCLAIPVGVASGVYLSEYASHRLQIILGFGVDLLASIPSIVMGLFGFTLIIFLRRTILPGANTSLILAAGCLAVLVLPGISRATYNSLAGLPDSLRLTGAGIGLTRWQSVTRVLIPAGSRGILSGCILGIGRAAEDTAVILLTGVVATSGLPRGLTEKFEALPFRIYVLASEHRDRAELDEGFGCALVLLLLTAALFACAFWLQRSFERKWSR
ncbi:MAG: ABC transporter permease subunit [Planctomycetes bacterium]|nr:ABC transporter permease subunit [Planctomycetota bacterium]